MGGPPAPRPLSNQDLAIWHTIQINHALENGALDRYPRLPATVRLSDGRGPLAVGGYAMLSYQDIQYEWQSGQPAMQFVNHVNYGNPNAIANSAVAGLTAAGVSALMNRRGRKKAEQMSGGRWVEEERGELLIGSTGILFRPGGHTYVWHYGGLQNAELVGPHHVRFEVAFDSGAVEERIIASDWAELCFVMWAHSQFPEHAQLRGRTWIPPGWFDRLQASGMRLPLGLTRG